MAFAARNAVPSYATQHTFTNAPEAALTLLWLAIRNITIKWGSATHFLKAAMQQFAILYEERFTDPHLSTLSHIENRQKNDSLQLPEPKKSDSRRTAAPPLTPSIRGCLRCRLHTLQNSKLSFA